MSDNWVVQNLENSLDVWNGKLTEIWQLITQSPQSFRGGTIWNVVVNIHGGLQAIGYALLVLFFVVGVMKTCGSFAELKKPEHAVKLFIRFALAKGVITYGMELMLALIEIVQGIISNIMHSGGFGRPNATTLPSEIVKAIEDCGFFESIPLWAVTLIGGLFIWVLSFIMILSVYGRFFKLYMYTAIAPIPLSTFAGEPTQAVGKSFLKSYAAVCLEGAIIVLACIIFSAFASTPPVVATGAAAATMVWRKVFLPKTVAEMLMKRKKQLEEYKDLLGSEFTDYNLVFCSEAGRPMEGQRINSALAQLIEKHNLPKVCFHSIRHTSTTYKLKLTGGDIKAVQGDTGHNTAQMVTERYAHILDDDRRVNAVRFEEAFYEKKELNPSTKSQMQPVSSINQLSASDEKEQIIEMLSKSPEMMALLKAMISKPQS